MRTTIHWIGLFSVIALLTGCSAPVTTAFPTQEPGAVSAVATLPAAVPDTPRASVAAPLSVAPAIETDQVVTSEPVLRGIKTPEAAGTPEGAQPPYLDDRSDPVSTLRSLFNAINRKEYVRAYSYWQNPGASPDVPPFPQFQQGYQDTASVDATFGSVVSNAGAGQIYYNVPVALKVQTTRGQMQTFVGCYTLHLAQPAIQATPPFEPLGIRSASVKQVANDANLSTLIDTVCKNVP
jgi:hypothetical protein